MTETSLIIFLAGMAAGWLLNDVLARLARMTQPAEVPMTTPPRRRRPRRLAAWPRGLGRWARARHSALVGAAALAAILFALVSGALQNRSAHDQNTRLAQVAQHNAQVSGCQSQFNERVTRSLAARAQINDQRTAVLVGFIGDLLSQQLPASLAEAAAQQRHDRALFAAFKARVADLSEQLAARRIPVLDSRCGTPAPVPSPATH